MVCFYFILTVFTTVGFGDHLHFLPHIYFHVDGQKPPPKVSACLLTDLSAWMIDIPRTEVQLQQSSKLFLLVPLLAQTIFPLLHVLNGHCLNLTLKSSGSFTPRCTHIRWLSRCAVLQEISPLRIPTRRSYALQHILDAAHLKTSHEFSFWFRKLLTSKIVAFRCCCLMSWFADLLRVHVSNRNIALRDANLAAQRNCSSSYSRD